MGNKRTYKQYSKEYKEEAVALIQEQGYSVPNTAKSLGIASNMLYRWKEQVESQREGKSLSEDELKRLRKENKNLRVEKEILKKSQRLLRERNEVKFYFIRDESSHYPVTTLCWVMQASTSINRTINRTPIITIK